jgi:hypothetical protein
MTDKLDGLDLYANLWGLRADGQGEVITDTRLIVTPSGGYHLHVIWECRRA